MELSLNFNTLDFQTKVSRLIVELSKLRIRNYTKVVSLENLALVQSETVLQELLKFKFKNGLFLPQDDKKVAQGYIFTDYEKDSADLSLTAIKCLRYMISKLSPKSSILSGMKIVDLLTRIKALSVSSQN